VNVAASGRMPTIVSCANSVTRQSSGTGVDEIKSDRNYLENTHPFYSLSLAMNLLYAAHEIPVEGSNYKGEPTKRSKLEDILTKPFIKHYLAQVNYTAREWSSGGNVQLTHDTFGPLSHEERESVKGSSIVSSKDSLDDFHQHGGWANGFANYKPKMNSEYTKTAFAKGDYFVAGGSGTTAGLLCAFVRLLELDHLVENNGNPSEMTLNRSSLKRDMLNLAMPLFAWMGLAGDHSLYEIGFAHAFMDKYCDRFMDDTGKLASASESDVKEIIGEIDKEKFLMDFLEQTRSECPGAVDQALEQFAAYLDSRADAHTPSK
jgi:hypothetical protein